MRPLELQNQKFGRLFVIEKDLKRTRPTHWICKCDCGNIRSVQGVKLKNGETKSCGCLSRELTSKRSTKHGSSNKNDVYYREYRIWAEIKKRCYNKNFKYYYNYGGRGISMCDALLDSFEKFISDVGKMPTAKHSLDRFPNNDGNYEPGNVRWATQRQQCRNKRTNKIVKYNDEKYTLIEFSEKIGVPYKNVWWYLKHHSLQDTIAFYSSKKKADPIFLIKFGRDMLNHPAKLENHLVSESKKTKLDSLNGCVLMLYFKKKFIIIKGRTAIGSLKNVFQAIRAYSGQKSTNLPEDNLYLHFVQYFWQQTRGYTFRVKVILQSENHIDLLKCEQTLLWQHNSDPNCLNNAIDAYIPLFRAETSSYGWINKGSVLNFLKWKGKNLPLPMPETSETLDQTGSHAHLSAFQSQNGT